MDSSIYHLQGPQRAFLFKMKSQTSLHSATLNMIGKKKQQGAIRVCAASISVAAANHYNACMPHTSPVDGFIGGFFSYNREATKSSITNMILENAKEGVKQKMNEKDDAECSRARDNNAECSRARYDNAECSSARYDNAECLKARDDIDAYEAWQKYYGGAPPNVRPVLHVSKISYTPISPRDAKNVVYIKLESEDPDDYSHAKTLEEGGSKRMVISGISNPSVPFGGMSQSQTQMGFFLLGVASVCTGMLFSSFVKEWMNPGCSALVTSNNHNNVMKKLVGWVRKYGIPNAFSLLDMYLKAKLG